MEENLRRFLMPYIGRGTQKNDTVTEEAVDLLVETAIDDHIEQEIIIDIRIEPIRTRRFGIF